jgi:predicted phosphodiesterase
MNKVKKIVILSDLHAPYEDKKAFTLALKVIKDIKPEYLILNGDIIDCYSVSSHPKTPGRFSNLKEEIQEAIQRIDELEACKVPNVIYIEGNHENRLERFLIQKAPELFGMVTISSLLQFDKRGMVHVNYKDFYRLGKVVYTHDLNYTGPQISRRALQDAQHSIVVGHAHRLSYTVEGDVTGKAKVGTCFGWLGDSKAADYMHVLKANRNWALGFGVGYMEKTGITHLVPVPIINYSCQVEGKIYSI